MDVAAKWLGLVGGLFGIVGGVFAVVLGVMNYFATQEQLRVVDCYQYHRNTADQAHAAVLTHRLLLPGTIEAAAMAEIAHRAAPDDQVLLVAYKNAVQAQNDRMQTIKDAREIVRQAESEANTCGHQQEQNFSPVLS